MGYGYMQMGVLNVDLKIDLDTFNAGKGARVDYTLDIGRRKGLFYRWALKAASGRGIWSKLKAVFWIKLGAPIPGYLERSVKALASEFLPDIFEITVKVK